MVTNVSVLDTTLRDGAQREGISFSVKDKLRIAAKLDELGIAYIEGGWPGSNPKDAEFFERARQMNWQHARLTAFASTRRANTQVEKDPNIHAAVRSGAPSVALVAKASAMHVRDVLRTTYEENLAMISETVAYLKSHGIKVLFDAEHFFDGYHLDPDYTLATLGAAVGSGADILVLCDTNGGCLPSQVASAVSRVIAEFPKVEVGIHAHNDTGVAVANTLVAVEQGASHIHGTINGYGERCGNADLCTVIPNLTLKMGIKALANGDMAMLTEVSHYVTEIANLMPDPHAPYVGHSAFAHKAGIHVSALNKNVDAYQHTDPKLVGNEMRILVSELSGRGNVTHKLKELDLDSQVTSDGVRKLTDQVKHLESIGYQYEGADGSFELLVRRGQPGYEPPFFVLDFLALVEKRVGKEILSEATVKVRVNDTVMHTAAEGDGPVNALDQALRKALLPFYPELEPVHLADFKVRILDPKSATAATVRVLIDASDGERSWTTMGCSVNIIEASMQALVSSLELPLLRRASANKDCEPLRAATH